MAIIQRLNWDSSFFGYEIGRAEIVNPNASDLKKITEESINFKLVYIFSEEELDYPGFQLVDKKVTYFQEIQKLPNQLSVENGIISFDKDEHSIEQLKALALESGKYSRFNSDLNFRNGEYEKLYREWLINSVEGELALDVLVCLRDHQILGFTTLAKKSHSTADIGLVAVHKDARGMGIGTNLIRHTIKEAAKRDFSFIQVVTQQDNIPAVHLYTRTNFILKEKSNIYHYWNL